MTYVYKNESFPYELCKDDIDVSDKIANVMYVGTEKYAVVGTVLILIQIIQEYCRCVNIFLNKKKKLICNLIVLKIICRTGSELSALSGMIGRQLAELLRHYNSRCWQLVLGAGAMQVAGLKSITSTILVLAARSLKLVLWLMPFVKTHFQSTFFFFVFFFVFFKNNIKKKILILS